MGIRWRVEDALAAGVHPLFALGASGSSFAPVSVGSTGWPSGPSGGGGSLIPMQAGRNEAYARPLSGSGLGKGLMDMGQDIGRAIAATSTADEIATNRMLKSQMIEKGDLENQLLATELAQKRSNSVALPSSPMRVDPFGVGDVMSGAMQARRKGNNDGTGLSTRHGFQSSINPAHRLVENADGSYTVFPSEKLEELATEGPYSYESYWQNRVWPHLSERARDSMRPAQSAGPGYDWQFVWGNWKRVPVPEIWNRAKALGTRWYGGR